MKIVNITDAEVHVKEVCTRKIKKKIKAKLYEDVRLDSEAKMSGINPMSMDEAQELSIVLMVEKVVLKDGKEVKPSVEWLDELADYDYEAILEAVNEVTNKELPKG